jgi:Ala-tRNA(Pro) deacylase
MIEASEQVVLQLLDTLAIPYTRREHPPVFTVEQARQFDTAAGGMHCKNLFLRNKKGDRYFLGIFEQSTSVDLSALGAHLGVGRLGLASPQRLQDLLGVSPGAVGLFALIHDRDRRVEVILDARLRSAAAIGFHPNVNTATLQISADDLMKFLAYCGSKVIWVE